MAELADRARVAAAVGEKPLLVVDVVIPDKPSTVWARLRGVLWTG